MNLSKIERQLLKLLIDDGPLYGTAQVGYHLWADRDMEPQGAAVAAGGVLRRLIERDCICQERAGGVSKYVITDHGIIALDQALMSDIDPRQLGFFEE